MIPLPPHTPPVTQLAAQFGTPTFFYAQSVIEERIRQLAKFDVIRYAQKAASNLAILAIMKRRGVCVDAVSAGEIYRALKAGYRGGRTNGVDEIVYTCDIFDRDSLDLVRDHKIHVNIGSPDMLFQLAHEVGPQSVTLRINPGFGDGHSPKVVTGGTSSKHGVWHEDLPELLTSARDLGMTVTGLHMHIGSGSEPSQLERYHEVMRTCANVIGATLRTISPGGGIPVPYRSDEWHFDTVGYFEGWHATRRVIEQDLGVELSLEIEPGRFLVAESGFLLTEIRAVKRMGSNHFYLVDAGFDNLVRPAMYGSYHDISIHPRTAGSSELHDVVVAGPLCESGDVFTQAEGGEVVTRQLPRAVPGDLLVIHTTGAYGSSMSSNYNTRKLAAEVLLSERGPTVIRERQSFEEMVASEKVPEWLR